MKITSRAAVFAAFGVGPLLLVAGCGGSSDPVGAEATLVDIQPTSFVELPPATTTTTTLAPVDTTPGISQTEQTYTIRAGDTLGGISSRFDVTLDQLISYNQFADGVNQLILPGDIIKIPPGGVIPGAVVETADEPATDSGDAGDAGDDDSASGGEGCTHTIAAGEFPNRVARQYDITYEQLQAANPNMDMTTTFVVGDTLVIPSGADCG